MDCLGNIAAMAEVLKVDVGGGESPLNSSVVVGGVDDIHFPNTAHPRTATWRYGVLPQDVQSSPPPHDGPESAADPLPPHSGS